jgi:hypothetical protein
LWAKDNIDKNPYLVINAIESPNGEKVPAGPVGYTKAPQIPPAMAALTQLAQTALTELLGAQQNGEKMESNISGRVVELIQQRLDMQSFIYLDNFSKAMKRAGQVWLSMMRDIAVEPSRRMKTMEEDGAYGSIMLNVPAYSDDLETEIVKNDITKASFDVDVDVGPASSSVKAGTVRALTGLATITDDPQIKRALTITTIANIEGNGLADLRTWARKIALRDGLVQPTEAEKRELAAEQQGQQPDAQSQYLLAEAEKAGALTTKAKADTVKVLADAEKSKADTAAILAGIGQADRKQAIDAAQAFQRAAT